MESSHPTQFNFLISFNVTSCLKIQIHEPDTDNCNITCFSEFYNIWSSIARILIIWRRYYPIFS